MKNWLTFLACLLILQGHAQDVFEKLIGGWETDAFGGKLYSYWQQDGKGGYLGQGVFLEGQDTTYREELRLFKIDVKWVLVASPENSDPFVFEVKEATHNEIRFENSRFRNPEKVLYRFESDGTFYRRTQGRNDDGSPAQNEYFFKKMKEVEGAPQFHIPGKKSIPAHAEILAPNLLSTEAPEFATTVSPDGKHLFFNRTNADRSKIYLMYSSWGNGKWSEPELAPFSDGSYKDVDPVFTPDGRYLFFSSTRPLKNRPAEDFNIWVVQNSESGFSMPQALTQNVNTENTEIFTSLTKEGHLYFSRRGDNMRDIVRCALKDKKYQPGEIQNINVGDARVGNPMVSPDEDYLIFNGVGLDGFGEADLYLCWKKTDGTWSTPVNMGSEINSEYVEFAPSISADGQYLYFTSERPGVVQDFEEGKRRPGDLYYIFLPPVLERLKQ